MIRFNCEYCGSMIRSPRQGIGHKGRCGVCQKIITVPAENYTVVPKKESQKDTTFSIDTQQVPILDKVEVATMCTEDSVAEMFAFKRMIFPSAVQMFWICGATMATIWFVVGILLAIAWASKAVPQFPAIHLIAPVVFVLALRMVCECAVIRWQTLQTLRAILKNLKETATR